MRALISSFNEKFQATSKAPDWDNDLQNYILINNYIHAVLVWIASLPSVYTLRMERVTNPESPNKMTLVSSSGARCLYQMWNVIESSIGAWSVIISQPKCRAAGKTAALFIA